MRSKQQLMEIIGKPSAVGRVYYFMDFTRMYIVGDFEIFAEIPEYCISIYAAKDCRLLKIPAKSYMSWIRRDENALFLRMKNIMATLTSERIVDREYIFMSCTERLADYLLKSYRNGKKDGYISNENGKIMLSQEQFLKLKQYKE